MAGQDAPPLLSPEADPDGDLGGPCAHTAVISGAWRAWRAEVAFAGRYVTDVPGLDAEGHDARPRCFGWIVHMTEECARHHGHADPLKERDRGVKAGAALPMEVWRSRNRGAGASTMVRAVCAEVPEALSRTSSAEGGPVMDNWPAQRTGPGDMLRNQARERLLDAARELFGVGGYAETTEMALCEAAGVPADVLRQEFGSREGLLIALHNRVTTSGLRAAERALHADDISKCGTAERVQRLFDAYVEAVTRDPREARVTFVEVLGVSATVDEHCKLWRALWTEFLTGEAERAVDRGEAEDRDHRVDVMVMVGTVHELMAHHSRRPRRARPGEVSGELTQLALTMLGSQQGE